MQSSRKQSYETEPRMDTDEHGSVIQAEKPLLAGKDFSSRNLRALGALRGFAVNPGFHREGAKHAKDSSLVAAGQICVHPCSSVATFFVQCTKTKILSSQRRIFALAVRKSRSEERRVGK